MRLKRLLIVPGWRLARRVTPKKLAWIPRSVRETLNLEPIIHEGELQNIGGIPSILGAENTYFLSDRLDKRLANQPEHNCPYPSCHGIGDGYFISQESLDATIAQVDAVLISIAAKDNLRNTISAAHKRNKPVAILDRPDHESLFGDENAKTHMFRGLIPHRDFDIYFKQDIPIDLHTDITRPISPLPVHPPSYEFNKKVKDISVFYSGRPRPEKCQRDRAQMIDLIKQHISNTSIVLHTTKSSFMPSRTYLNNLSRTKIALSPSGRVWDSYRHCEIALAPQTALLAPEPYTATCGPKLKDGVNAILYKVHRIGKRYELNDPDIVEKIRFYLANNDQREKLAEKWHEDVMQGHTVHARSKYILKEIDTLLTT